MMMIDDNPGSSTTRKTTSQVRPLFERHIAAGQELCGTMSRCPWSQSCERRVRAGFPRARSETLDVRVSKLMIRALNVSFYRNLSRKGVW